MIFIFKLKCDIGHSWNLIKLLWKAFKLFLENSQNRFLHRPPLVNINKISVNFSIVYKKRLRSWLLSMKNKFKNLKMKINTFEGKSILKKGSLAKNLFLMKGFNVFLLLKKLVVHFLDLKLFNLTFLSWTRVKPFRLDRKNTNLLLKEI